MNRADAREDMTSVAVSARQRVLGLSKTQARQALETSVLGKLEVQGEITRTQYEAGKEYAEVVREWLSMIGAKDAASGGDFNRSGGYDDSDGTDPQYRKRFNAARTRYELVLSTIRQTASTEPNVGFVVHGVCRMDLDCGNHVGTLRIGLNALARALNVVDAGVDSRAKSNQITSLMQGEKFASA